VFSVVGGLYFDICNISMSELLAEPQSAIQYVQMGFRIVKVTGPEGWRLRLPEFMTIGT
jgi:hypothetical protein